MIIFATYTKLSIFDILIVYTENTYIMKYYRLYIQIIVVVIIGLFPQISYGSPADTIVISPHTDALRATKPNGEPYQGGSHVIGSGSFANSLQKGLYTSAGKFGVIRKPGVGETIAVNENIQTLTLVKNAGVTQAALIEVGAHSDLIDKYGGPSEFQNSSYLNDVIDNVIGPNVGGTGKIVIPMDHSRRRIPDSPGGNTFIGADATGAAEYRGYSERDMTDIIAQRIQSKFGSRVVIIKPEDYPSYEDYDKAILAAIGGESSATTPDGSLPPGAQPGEGGAQGSSAVGTGSYISYTNFPGIGRISTLCQLITALWYLGFIILFTAVIGMFTYGGYMYVTAGVNAGKVNQAKEIFTNTTVGLVLGLSIYIILNIINPGLLTANCTIRAATSAGGTNQAATGNITPKPGESVFPVTGEYQCPGPKTKFGYGRGRLHAGVDLTPPYTVTDSQALQLPILAFRDGVVQPEIGGYYGVVLIKHADGISTRYLHNSKIFVNPGDTVQAGQEIAKMGDAGSPGVIHAHFEVYQNGSVIDPAGVIFDGNQQPDSAKVKTTNNPRCVGQNI